MFVYIGQCLHDDLFQIKHFHIIGIDSRGDKAGDVIQIVIFIVS